MPVPYRFREDILPWTWNHFKLLISPRPQLNSQKGMESWGRPISLALLSVSRNSGMDNSWLTASMGNAEAFLHNAVGAGPMLRTLFSRPSSLLILPPLIKVAALGLEYITQALRAPIEAANYNQYNRFIKRGLYAALVPFLLPAAVLSSVFLLGDSILEKWVNKPIDARVRQELNRKQARAVAKENIKVASSAELIVEDKLSVNTEKDSQDNQSTKRLDLIIYHYPPAQFVQLQQKRDTPIPNIAAALISGTLNTNQRKQLLELMHKNDQEQAGRNKIVDALVTPQAETIPDLKTISTTPELMRLSTIVIDWLFHRPLPPRAYKAYVQLVKNKDENNIELSQETRNNLIHEVVRPILRRSQALNKSQMVDHVDQTTPEYHQRIEANKHNTIKLVGERSAKLNNNEGEYHLRIHDA